jgi:hypothetical protein
LSDIVAVANNVPGVQSVVMLYPPYTSGADQIRLGADEKALILDSTADVSIVTIGG